MEQNWLGLAIYIAVYVISFGIIYFLFSQFDKSKEKKRIREQRKIQARFYETIDYTNFNVKTGEYENQN